MREYKLMQINVGMELQEQKYRNKNGRLAIDKQKWKNIN